MAYSVVKELKDFIYLDTKTFWRLKESCNWENDFKFLVLNFKKKSKLKDQQKLNTIKFNDKELFGKYERVIKKI